MGLSVQATKRFFIYSVLTMTVPDLRQEGNLYWTWRTQRCGAHEPAQWTCSQWDKRYQTKAEIYSYISRVETISYMESILFGDPFDFLSNVPKYLSNLPLGSVLRQLYRSRTCRWVFTMLGVKEFFLFYTYIPNKQVTLKPDVNRKCCILAGDEMGGNIILAAMEVLSFSVSCQFREGCRLFTAYSY